VTAGIARIQWRGWSCCGVVVGEGSPMRAARKRPPAGGKVPQQRGRKTRAVWSWGRAGGRGCVGGCRSWSCSEARGGSSAGGSRRGRIPGECIGYPMIGWGACFMEEGASSGSDGAPLAGGEPGRMLSRLACARVQCMRRGARSSRSSPSQAGDTSGVFGLRALAEARLVTRVVGLRALA
jgi:hypothetical protein